MSAQSHSDLCITGSTGRLGGRVARRLGDANISQTLLVRDPARAPQLPGAAVTQSEYADRETAERALDGVERLFMVSGAETPDRVDQHRTFIDAAVAAGVRHIVYTSFFGAAPDATFTLARDHWATEEHIRSTGLAFTFLRDNLYADFLPLMTGDDGIIRGPAGQGRFAAVTQDDIADAAVAVLTNPADHDGATYDLTGPESLTFDEAAEIISRETGRAVRYHAETVDEAYRSRSSYGAPDWQLDAWVSTYTAIAAGELDGVSDAIPRLTGHPATSLAQMLRRA